MRSGLYQPVVTAYVLVGVLAVGCAVRLFRYLRQRPSRPSVEQWLPSSSPLAGTNSKITPVRPTYRRSYIAPSRPRHPGYARHELLPATPDMPPILVPNGAPAVTAAPIAPRPPGQLYQDPYSTNSAVPYDPWRALYSSMAARGQTKPTDLGPRQD